MEQTEVQKLNQDQQAMLSLDTGTESKEKDAAQAIIKQLEEPGAYDKFVNQYESTSEFKINHGNLTDGKEEKGPDPIGDTERKISATAKQNEADAKATPPEKEADSSDKQADKKLGDSDKQADKKLGAKDDAKSDDVLQHRVRRIKKQIEKQYKDENTRLKAELEALKAKQDAPSEAKQEQKDGEDSKPEQQAAERVSELPSGSEEGEAPKIEDYSSENEWLSDMERWENGQEPYGPSELTTKADDKAEGEQTPEAKPEAPPMTLEQKVGKQLDIVYQSIVESDLPDEVYEKFKDGVDSGRIEITETVLEAMADSDDAYKIAKQFVDRPILAKRLTYKSKSEQIDMLNQLAAKDIAKQDESSKQSESKNASGLPNIDRLKGVNSTRKEMNEMSQAEYTEFVEKAYPNQSVFD